MDPRESAAHYGTLDELRRLYQPGDAETFRNFLGETLLEIAAMNPRLPNAIEIVQFLVDEGADATVCRDDGLNVFHRVFSRHDNSEVMIPMLERLVSAGADYNAVAKRIGTPADLLYRMTINFKEERILPLFRYLLTLPDIDLARNSLKGESFVNRLEKGKDYRPQLWRAVHAHISGIEEESK